MLRGVIDTKPTLQVNLRALLHRLRTCVLLDLCFISFDNPFHEKKSTGIIFLRDLIYNNNSSMIIKLGFEEWALDKNENETKHGEKVLLPVRLWSTQATEGCVSLRGEEVELI